MKLYRLPVSPNSRKVVAVIKHLGLDIPMEQLDFARGETRHPDFLALNPNAMVPVLVDGDFRLWESAAIMIYLTDKAGNEVLFPPGREARADVLRWLFWEQAHFNKAFGTLVFEGLIKPKFGMGEASPGLLDFQRRELDRFARVLEVHMQGRAFLVGDQLTLADFAMVCMEGYRDKIGFDWSRFANVNRYLDEIREVPAWRATAPASLLDAKAA
ncbi:glutathione S-transferase family protein [Micromonospora sp. STR1s_5]|nr:glutathione S-transferase family protein [Micromonospora sp. STR1s_5]